MKRIAKNILMGSVKFICKDFFIDKTVIDDIEVTFIFHNYVYETSIPFQSLINDESYDFSISGDEELFDSFEEAIQLNFDTIKYHIIAMAKTTCDDLIIPEITVES